MKLTTIFAIFIFIAGVSETRLKPLHAETTPPQVEGIATQISLTPTVTVFPTLTPTPSPKAVNAKPYLLKIDRISVNAPIIEQGENPQGRMGVPPDERTVGWWMHGARPGDMGSAVLAGHYTIDDGSPGIFYKLRELGIGDEIKVISEDLKEKVFTVYDIQIYQESDFPLKEVFNNNDSVRLNLITCDGEYIPSTDNYSHRRVVYSVLKEAI